MPRRRRWRRKSGGSADRLARDPVGALSLAFGRDDVHRGHRRERRSLGTKSRRGRHRRCRRSNCVDRRCIRVGAARLGRLRPGGPWPPMSPDTPRRLPPPGLCTPVSVRRGTLSPHPVSVRDAPIQTPNAQRPPAVVAFLRFSLYHAAFLGCRRPASLAARRLPFELLRNARCAALNAPYLTLDV